MESYLERKLGEIALLNAYLASPLELAPAASPAMVIEQKLRLAAAIRAERSLHHWSFTETARTPAERATAGAFEFRYDYQRADLRVEGPSLYAALCRPGASAVLQTVYAASGMGALAALFTALPRLGKPVEVMIPDGCYSETRELLASLGAELSVLPLGAVARRRRNALRIALLDSSLRADFFGFQELCAQDYQLVVFDTTCFWRSSGRIARVVDWAFRAGVPLALARSHTKLDCLGVEYGRLGSVVLAEPPLASARLPWLSELATQMGESVRLFGLAPTPASFPPYTHSRDFEHYSRLRIAAAISSNRRLARRLAAELGSNAVLPTQHGLYLMLRPDQDWSRDDARLAAATVCDEVASPEIPVSHAGSFGFDFVAIDAFVDALSQRDVLRVAASDLPSVAVDALADGIARWWQRSGLGAAPRASAPRRQAAAIQ